MWQHVAWWVCNDVSEETAAYFFVVTLSTMKLIKLPMKYQHISTTLPSITSQRSVNSMVTATRTSYLVQMDPAGSIIRHPEFYICSAMKTSHSSCNSKRWSVLQNSRYNIQCLTSMSHVNKSSLFMDQASYLSYLQLVNHYVRTAFCCALNISAEHTVRN
jgi:hypothetical protein